MNSFILSFKSRLISMCVLTVKIFRKPNIHQEAQNIDKRFRRFYKFLLNSTFFLFQSFDFKKNKYFQTLDCHRWAWIYCFELEKKQAEITFINS